MFSVMIIDDSGFYVERINRNGYSIESVIMGKCPVQWDYHTAKTICNAFSSLRIIEYKPVMKGMES